MRYSPFRIIALIGIAFLLAGLLQVEPARAATVYHSPNWDGQPPPVEPHPLPAPEISLDLWIDNGSTATVVTTAKKICANGEGHELCGWQIELVTTGGITIDQFDPETGLDGPPIQYYVVDDTTIKINRVNAAQPNAGDLGPTRIGELTLNVLGQGEVQLTAKSVALGASLQTVSFDTGALVTVPEPGLLLGLVAGGACLALLWRRRQMLLASSALILGVAGLPAPGWAQLYLDQTAFQNALGGSSVQTQDFESIPLDGNGDAAFGNGHDFGGFTFRSISVTVPWLLRNEQEVPTSLLGTALVESMSIRWNSTALSPGGSGDTGDPTQIDSFVLEFTTPVRAAGIKIVDNEVDGIEFVQFRDSQDQVLGSVTLAADDAFYGFVSPPPAEPIASIFVAESDEPWSDGDDIFVDDVTWAEEVVPPTPPQMTPLARIERWKQYSVNTPGLAGAPGGLGASHYFGASVAGIGDLNGDSVPDAAVGASGDSDGDTQAGALWILFLERDGDIRSAQKISNTQGELSGRGNPGSYLVARSSFGASVAPLGNLDGDPAGTIDLAVGATEYLAGSGSVYILFMRRDGTVERVQPISATEGAAGGGGLGALLSGAELFGSDVELLGDLDHDGRPELAVGAASVWSTGSVFILSLNPDGTFDLMRELSNDEPSLTAHVTLQVQDYFGADIAALGDLDLDGIPDLAVGSPGSDVSGPTRGAVHVLFLNADGSVKDVAPISWPSFLSFGGLNWFGGDADFFGHSLQWIPTPNASTPGILAVGMSGFDPISPFYGSADEGDGAVVFHTLDSSGSAIATGQVFRTRSSEYYSSGVFDPPLGEAKNLGASMGYLGDLDDDGSPDVIAGATWAAVGGQVNVGAAYLFPITGLDPIAMADAVVATSGPVSSAQDIVGWPDPAKQGAVIYDGSSITVQFVDNFAMTGGDIGTDIIIHREADWAGGASGSERLIIEASTDGQTYYNIEGTWFQKELRELAIDLHEGDHEGPTGLSPTDQVRFIRITMESSDCVYNPPLPCSPVIPRYVAVEAVTNRNIATDTDYDGVMDGVDNCLNFRNPGQDDLDGDGWGNFCDVCPTVANPDQSFVCIPPVIELEGPFASTNPTTEAEWIVSMKGGSLPETYANIGIIVPPDTDPDDMDFGSTTAPIGAGCDKPPASEATGIGGGGVGCSTANISVNPAQSGMIRPMDTGGLGLRNDVVYLALDAADQVKGFSQPDQKTVLGRVVATYPTPRDLRDLTAIGWWRNGFDWLPQDEPPWWDNNREDGYKGPFNPSILMSLELEQVSGGFRVCMQSGSPINRMTFDIVADDTLGELYWDGCENYVGGPNEERTCSGAMPGFPNVLQALSRTYGPYAGEGRLTVQLGGNAIQGDQGILSLNGAGGDSKCLGIVHVASGTTPTIGPSPDTVPSAPLIRVGIDYDPFGSTPEEYTLCEPELGEQPNYQSGTLGKSCDPVANACETGEECVFSYRMVSWGTAAVAGDDIDADNVRDEDDNCTFYWNALQEDAGGTSLGDACECGDLDFSGDFAPVTTDLAIMRDIALGKNQDEALKARCSVEGGDDCTIRDVVYLHAATGSTPVVSLSAACADAHDPAVTTPSP